MRVERDDSREWHRHHGDRDDGLANGSTDSTRLPKHNGDRAAYGDAVSHVRSAGPTSATAASGTVHNNIVVIETIKTITIKTRLDSFPLWLNFKINEIRFRTISIGLIWIAFP